MKSILNKIFNPGNLPCNQSLGLLLLRIVVAAFMLTHGTGKLIMLIQGQAAYFPDPMGIGPHLSLILAVSAEFLSSILILLGLATRLAAIPLWFTMMVAAFLVHGADPFSVKEFALLYGTIFAFFFIVGPGKYSLDYLIASRCNTSSTEPKGSCCSH